MGGVCIFYGRLFNACKYKAIVGTKLLLRTKEVLLQIIISLGRELFAKYIYVANVRFKSILEPYKCQIAKYLPGICSETHRGPSH